MYQLQEKDPQKLVLAAYKSCLASLRSAHAVRRASTLQLISPVRYSQEERELIPSTVVDEIVSLNNLDMDLYKHAETLFAKQQRRFTTSTHPQFQEDGAVILSMFSALCVAMSILLLGLAFILRIRHRVGNDWLPFWLRRLAFMPVHEKL